MIIKIMKLNRVDFWMCDNVESVFVEHWEGDGTVRDSCTSKVACSIFEEDDNPVSRKSWVIDFKLKKDDERYVALFNTMAYICNDSGQTVEKICG